MKRKHCCYFLLVVGFLAGCQEDPQIPASRYACELDTLINTHPRAAVFQAILDENIKKGIVGVSVYLQTNQGTWTGTAGKADLASAIDLRPCHRMMIASCSKTLTAIALMLLQEQGKLHVRDLIRDYLPSGLLSDIANAREARVIDLMSHRSGIADYYTTKFELDRVNTFYNGFTARDLLDYVRGKSAQSAVGGAYSYSNTNYVLLGLIIEQITQQRIDEALQSLLLEPFELTNTSFHFRRPPDLVRGYYPSFSDDYLVESEDLYGDELGSADGGIISTASDLGKLMQALGQGMIVDPNSLAQMTDWFVLAPAGAYQHTQNGLGLEYHETDFGAAYGHGGSADGFYSVMHYFPAQNATLVILTNGTTIEGFDAFRVNLYHDLLREMRE